MAQLGKIHASLSNLRLDQIGSLVQEVGSYLVGKCPENAFHQPFCGTDETSSMRTMSLLGHSEIQRPFIKHKSSPYWLM